MKQNKHQILWFSLVCLVVVIGSFSIHLNAQGSKTLMKENLAVAISPLFGLQKKQVKKINFINEDFSGVTKNLKFLNPNAPIFLDGPGIADLPPFALSVDTMGNIDCSINSGRRGRRGNCSTLVDGNDNRIYCSGSIREFCSALLLGKHGVLF